MKKHKKRIIVGGIILLLIVLGFFLFNVLNDENRLTVNEKSWINRNSGTVQNVSVVNDINVFGKEGSGVFFDFIDDFKKQYNLEVNPISNDTDNSSLGISFKVSNNLEQKDLLVYKDHFVLVSKKNEPLKTVSEFTGKKIGVLNTNFPYIANYLSNINNITFVQYNSPEALMEALRIEEEINYMLVPANEYMDYILVLNYYIIYHLGDIPVYYSIELSDNEPDLSNIVKKYYNIWMDSRFSKSYNKHNLNLFVESLGIVQKDKDTLTSRVYNYGFITNSPYEVIMGGTYGGIISTYLKKFSDFSNVEFKFIKYKRIGNLYNAINKKNIDLYFNTMETTDEFKIIPSLLNINFSIIAKKSNYTTVNSLNSLSGEKVYVLDGSILSAYLKTINYLDVHTYKDVKSIKKIKDENAIIIIDTNIYNYYNNNVLKDYTSRYTENLSRTYNFKTNINETFNKLLGKYINSLDPEEMINNGINNHAITVKNGTFISRIATYSLYIIIVLIIGGILFYRQSKKISLTTKIKKDEKIRFIDQLTSLKNRNYLSENVEKWNNNTIYPQAAIVMDLNNIQEINDTLGYDQGDAQIKAGANVLIKTQLDNSDVIRTDGNEFLIYLIGYSEKQIVSYIRKIYKELKTMPFDYGAAIGYSMIIDDLKTVEDAINEAIEDMRIKKSESYEE